MPLSQLIEQAPGTRLVGEGGVEIHGLTLDSRRAGPGYLFAALRGEKNDGFAFLDEALARGAVAVLSDRPRPVSVDCAWALTASPRESFAALARAFHSRPDEKMPVIGITGTNGKTTIAWLLEAIFSAAGLPTGLLGTVSYRIAGRETPASRTTPEADALFEYLDRMVQAGCRYAVMEVSSHALALRRVHGLRFAAGVFTNLTQDHLDFHGTMEHYFESKAILFESLPASSLAILNADSPATLRLAGMTEARVVTFGSVAGADFRMGEVLSSFDGVRFRLEREGRSIEVVSPLPGLPNASNVSAGLATALSLGIDEEAALAGVRVFRGAPGRFERIDRGQDFHVIVDYAHTPDAIENLLGAVRALAPARIVTVFGCGGDRDRGKRPLMGAAAARGSDEVILTSDNPRGEDPERILDDAEAGIRSVPGAVARLRRIPDRREAIAASIALAAAGEAVVIAGKGHEATQIVGDRILPFDDRAVAAECLDIRMGRG